MGKVSEQLRRNKKWKKQYEHALECATECVARHGDNRLAALREMFVGLCEAIAQMSERATKDPKIQCRRGCAFCCSLRVSCAPFEAFSVAQWVLTHWSEDDITELRQKMIATAARPIGLYDRMRPCAFLKNNECSIYEQRPVMCRSHFSADRNACEQTAGGARVQVPTAIEPKALHGIIQHAIDAASEPLKLNMDKVIFNDAVLIALDDFDGTLKQWLDAGDPFKGRHEPADDYPTGLKARRSRLKAQ